MERDRKKEITTMLRAIAVEIDSPAKIIADGHMEKKARDLMVEKCEMFISYNKELNELK